jgi:superfamily II DNA/RNA helicase
MSPALGQHAKIASFQIEKIIRRARPRHKHYAPKLAATVETNPMVNEYSKNPKLTATLIACLQEWGIKSLTDIQSKTIEAEVPLGQSAIVCAPTSSGKTLVVPVSPFIGASVSSRPNPPEGLQNI